MVLYDSNFQLYRDMFLGKKPLILRNNFILIGQLSQYSPHPITSKGQGIQGPAGVMQAG